MAPQLLLVLICIAGGTLILILGIPLTLGRIPRNGIYGFRTAKTLASDEAWYPANRFAGGQMIRAGAEIVALSLALLAMWRTYHISVAGVGYLALLFTVIPLVSAVYRSVQYASRL
ncbi:MAG: SdpI family protein [Chthonomonadales bacterium]